MNKRTTKKIQPEQKLNSKPKDDDMHVSPVIANTNVGGWFAFRYFCGSKNVN